jgi:anti-sigma B factor antagonist
MLSFSTRESAGVEVREELTRMQTGLLSSDGGRHVATAWAANEAGREPFTLEVQQRDLDLAIVRPRGELDLATVETLRTALENLERPGRLMLDLRNLSFIDSTGLHLLVELHRRAQSDGFQLMLVAPTAPADRAIALCGLDKTLPFVAAAEVVDGE